ncbi:hypothetical protein [Nevskia soli]|uniref:hypothetical protein n=1 Tax=Nevskia soli TaxID=418856 RepID=UPI0004A6E1FE|nr:hypothetical protein [Nevskia soli]
MLEDLLNIPARDPRAAALIKQLETLLAVGRAELTRVAMEPLAPHLRAEIKPIAAAAKKLAALLDPQQHTGAARSRLAKHGGPNPDLLRKHLAGLEFACAQADKALLAQGKGSGGELRRRQKQVRDTHRRMHSSFFDRCAVDGTAEDKQEFLELCEKYLRAA